MALVYYKNRFLPEDECFVPISDRSFRFGDGVFETLLVHNGAIYDFDHHFQRLENGLAAYRLPLETSGIEALCHELIAKNRLAEGFLRIVVSRGENGKDAVGYLPKGTTPWMMIQSIEKPYPVFRGLKLWVSSHPASVHTPSKTNNALTYTLALMEAEDHGCDNALMLNDQGIICETASGNIFWLKDGTLYTPSLDLPLVPGTMRRRAIELWDGPIEEGRFPLAALQDADEIFMTNIASILAAVTSIMPAGIERPPGECTRLLRQTLDRDIMGSLTAK